VTEPAAPAPAASTTTSATSTAPQTEAAPATSAPAPVRGATTLQHLARTVDAAMQMGHSRGITRARLHLHPAELGAIELHLRHTANGMTARVVAESPEAVAVLQQASNDLRRSLEQAGITLTGLDIGSRADQQAEQRTFAGAFDASDRDSDRGSNGRGSGLGTGRESDTDPVQPIRTRVPLGGGALVDVIA
jgi:flagellar hook-length control protein FliK